VNEKNDLSWSDEIEDQQLVPELKILPILQL
jgi:hypothetical protein